MSFFERCGRSRSARGGVVALSLMALALMALASVARADEASGTWTGQLEARANYYWETSTRVVAPEVQARLVSPDGVTIDAGYLVDAITSASIAAGAQEDIRFTEIRNQLTAGVGRELDLGEAQLRLGLSGRFSHEPDYVATGVGMAAALSLNQRSTVISANVTYIHDIVGAVLRGGESRTDDEGRDLSDRGRQGQLEGLATGVTWTQVLAPVATLSVGYDFVHNWGYLQNPYRAVAVGGGLLPEAHPELRTRHSLHGRFAYLIPESGTSFHLLYRAYVDDWDVAAITPEVRLYQMLGPRLMLRLRYRFYNQTRAHFYEDSYETFQPLLTADPKMSAFLSHLIGTHLRVGLDFLRGTALGFFERAWLDLSFEYLLQTNRFGDAIIAQAGLRVPF